MSFQELHIRALEDQVLNLTRDCYYLMSLLNAEDNIDWDSWEQGRKIKEDLERSKDFFDVAQRRQKEAKRYEVQKTDFRESARSVPPWRRNPIDSRLSSNYCLEDVGKFFDYLFGAV